MRTLACQFWLSLTVLVVQPLLGVGAQAQASYLAVDPLRDAATLAQLLEDSSTSAMGEAVDEPKSESDPRRKGLPDSARFVLGSLDLLWTGQGQSGAGCGSPSGFASLSGSGQYAAASTQANLPPLQMAGWLLLEDVQSRPPPFASRLFRPPRRS